MNGLLCGVEPVNFRQKSDASNRQVVTLQSVHYNCNAEARLLLTVTLLQR